MYCTVWVAKEALTPVYFIVCLYFVTCMYLKFNDTMSRGTWVFVPLSIGVEGCSGAVCCKNGFKKPDLVDNGLNI